MQRAKQAAHQSLHYVGAAALLAGDLAIQWGHKTSIGAQTGLSLQVSAGACFRFPSRNPAQKQARASVPGLLWWYFYGSDTVPVAHSTDSLSDPIARTG